MSRAIIVALVLLLSVPALAQQGPPPPASRFELGARLGFGLPFGSITAEADNISETISGTVSVWFDGLYRVTPTILVGLYLHYGFLVYKDCPEDVSCGGHDLRVGPQVRFDLGHGGSMTPWLALGIGYEQFSFEASQGGFTFTADATGWEFLNAQFGLDFRVGPRFKVGPFVSFSVDQTTSIPDFGGGGDFDKSLHEWLLIGGRGAFDL